MTVKHWGSRVSSMRCCPRRAATASRDRLHGLVKRYRFERLIGHLAIESRPGRPGSPVLVLFKALLLQSLYGLSDRELEEALDDRLSFRRFVGLCLEDRVPDHMALNRFCNRLVAEGLLEKLFAELDRQLEKAGLILKRGTMLDATLIEAAAPPPRDDRPSQDPDARFTRRSGKPGFGFGFKAHACRRRRGQRPHPHGRHDRSPRHRHGAGRCADPRRRAGGDGGGAYHTHARQLALEARGVKGAADASAEQTPSGAAAAARPLQPPDRPPVRGGGDDLRHAEEPDAADAHPLHRPRQGWAGAAGRDGLQLRRWTRLVPA